MSRPRRLLLVLAAIGLLAPAAPAGAADSPEATLAARYAPVVRLVGQTEPCGSGEPYTPMSVDPVFGNDQVALRGPWTGDNLVKVAPTADDVASGRDRYHLDFPGNALRPKCDYEAWQRSLPTLPTTYAHVVSEEGQTALQYWFFYVYNDYNDRHEGDWEMIQLNFPAATAAAAVAVSPSEAGFAQHNGGERAAWGDAKLELADATHPVVYPAAGSHADYFGPAVYLGRSAAQGVGCDNTRGPHREVRPSVELVPTDPVAARQQYPWIGFRGFWGEEQAIYNNGPTGPSAHDQWDHPIVWSQTSWHPAAFAIPGAINGVPSATSFFCGAVAKGSSALNLALNSGTGGVLVLLVLILAGVWSIIRADWRPSQPLALARRRGAAQTIAASLRMYRRKPLVFLSIGALFLPVSLVTIVLQELVFRAFGLDALEDVAGSSNPAVAGLAMAIGVVTALLALTFVQAMTASAIEDGGDPTALRARDAYAAIRSQLDTLLAALAVVGVVVAALQFIVLGIPIAIWLIVRWSLFAQCVVLEDLSWRNALRRSAALVHGHWLRTAAKLVICVGVALLLGPLAGVCVLLVTPVSLAVVNVISGVVYTLTIPIAAIATTYIYFDLRVREAVEHDPATLPAETALELRPTLDVAPRPSL